MQVNIHDCIILDPLYFSLLPSKVCFNSNFCNLNVNVRVTYLSQIISGSFSSVLLVRLQGRRRIRKEGRYISFFFPSFLKRRMLAFENYVFPSFLYIFPSFLRNLLKKGKKLLF